MPIKKRAARKPRRRAGKRKGMSSGATTTVNRSLQPFADRYICKQKYSCTVPTDAVTGQRVFNLNSIFDPDRTGLGHQPYATDSLTPIYNKYRVISCGWRVQVPLTGANPPLTLGCLPSNDPGIVWSSTDELLENPRCRYITQLPGSPAATLSGKIYLPKLIGKTKAQYMADEDCASLVTANPVEIMLLYLQTFGAQSGLPSGGINLQVVLEFTVEYFDAKRILSS